MGVVALEGGIESDGVGDRDTTNEDSAGEADRELSLNELSRCWESAALARVVSSLRPCSLLATSLQRNTTTSLMF